MYIEKVLSYFVVSFTSMRHLRGFFFIIIETEQQMDLSEFVFSAGRRKQGTAISVLLWIHKCQSEFG